MCYEPKSFVSSFRNDFKVSYRIKNPKFTIPRFNGLIHCNGVI